MPGEASHPANVLLTSHGMDYTSCSQEQQRFEESMSDHVKHARCKGARSHGDEHETQLAHCRIGENLLDVVLTKRDGCRKQGSSHARYSDDFQCNRRQGVQDIAPCDHVNTSGYHRSGMDQSRHRCRAGHRVGQPCKQWYLSALSDCANKKQYGDPGNDRLTFLKRSRGEDIDVSDASKMHEDEDNA